MAKRLQHDMTSGERNYTAWFVGAIVAVVAAIGLAIWGTSNDDNSASTSSGRPTTGTLQQQTTGSAAPTNNTLQQQPAGSSK